MRKLEVHVDGSCSEDRAIWGLVAIAHGWQGELCFIGAAGGPAAQVEAPCFAWQLPEELAPITNNTAELNAGMWGAVAVYKLGFLRPCQVEICYDNLLIAGALQSGMTFRANASAAALAELAFQFLAMSSLPTLRHVAGRTGHPWHEFADAVAKGRCQGVPASQWPAWIARLRPGDLHQAAVLANMRRPSRAPCRQRSQVGS